MDKTQPRLSGTETTGVEQVSGRKVKRQPKLRALSLMKDTVTIGLKIKPKFLFNYSGDPNIKHVWYLNGLTGLVEVWFGF